MRLEVSWHIKITVFGDVIPEDGGSKFLRNFGYFSAILHSVNFQKIVVT
jgi:hypothetical protein